MSDTAPTQPHDDGTNAWLRVYAEAERRAARSRRQDHPYLRYRQREVRWVLVAIAVAVTALLLATWASFR